MINTALDQGGYTVLVALNGRQALDIVRQIQPNVVLTDAVMPVMDGFEYCREMKKTAATDTGHLHDRLHGSGA